MSHSSQSTPKPTFVGVSIHLLLLFLLCCHCSFGRGCNTCCSCTFGLTIGSSSTKHWWLPCCALVLSLFLAANNNGAQSFLQGLYLPPEPNPSYFVTPTYFSLRLILLVAPDPSVCARFFTLRPILLVAQVPLRLCARSFTKRPLLHFAPNPSRRDADPCCRAQALALRLVLLVAPDPSLSAHFFTLRPILRVATCRLPSLRFAPDPSCWAQACALRPILLVAPSQRFAPDPSCRAQASASRPFLHLAPDPSCRA